MDNKNIERGIRVVVGVLTFVFVFWLIQKTGIVSEFLRPQVESGKLGSSTATLWAVAIEVLSGVGGAVIFLASAAGAWVIQALHSVTSPKTDLPDNSDPPELRDDLTRLLLQSITEQNATLTREIIRRMAGSDYLDEAEK